jgi:CBS domain containing-hemolysin-like protein
MSYQAAIILLSLVFSAFFSGMEIAFISSNKIQLEIEKKQKGFLSRLLKKITQNPSKFIATMLIGNNVALVIYGLYMGDFLINLFSTLIPTKYLIVDYFLVELNLFTQTIFSSIVILITAEFLPKVFFQIYSNTLVKLFAFPAYFFYIIFSFLSSFVIKISDFVLKKYLRTSKDKSKSVFSKVDLENYINEQMENVDENDQIDNEIVIFQNALEFSEVRAKEVMVPRTELSSIEIHDSINNLSDLFTHTGHSKIIVYKNTIDDILGYVHAFDLFKNPKSIKSIMMPVKFVPETMLAKDVLNFLTKKRRSLAVVLDEYGGTSGILTIEDIVEELFGEIEDEHDIADLIEQVLEDNVFLFSARLEVDYVNENHKLQLPTNENYETIGGLIVFHTETIPSKNESIKIGDFEFIVEKVSNTKIELVTLKIISN